jgi:hypothetical protein
MAAQVQNNSLYMALEQSQTQPSRFVSKQYIYLPDFYNANTINVALDLVDALPSTHSQSLARNPPQ